MSIESITDVHLSLEDLEDPEWLLESSNQEDAKLSILSFTAPISQFERVKNLLCALRAANAPAMLFVERPEPPPSMESLTQMLDFLKSWDQLTLHNLLQLCQSWIPQTFTEPLNVEARYEIKWFKEWLMASHDARISKYPGLPWRSFMRKIVSENHEFALGLLKIRPPGQPAVPTDEWIKNFLASKKKTVCLFPKKWSRMQ